MTKNVMVGISDKEVTLGQTLRGLRKDKKLKQQDISEYLGVERVTCSAYENDRIVPPADKLYKLAELYGISIELLASKTLTKKNSDKAVNNIEESNGADLKSAEMMYYYKNLDDSQRKIVFELIKELYRK